MLNSNLAYATIKSNISVPEWDYLISETAKVFRLRESEINQLENSTTAKIIAMIPFAAGCNNPERIAISHIGIFLMEIKGYQDYCCHLPSDDSNIYNRLERISHFDGGNQEIIEHGMAILALIMLEGYKKSLIKDIKNKTYNPIASHAWNYKAIKNSLYKKIEEVNCPGLDDLYYTEVVSDWM